MKSLQSYIKDIFCDYNSNALPNNLQIDDTYKKYISIDIKQKNIIVPLIIRNQIEIFIKNSFYNLTYDKITVPLVFNNQIEKRNFKTVSRIFREMYYNNTFKLLNKVLYKDNTVYYVGKGIIMDGDMNPLLMLALKINFNEEINIMEYTHKVVYINKKVYTEQKNPLHNYIIKSIPSINEIDISSYIHSRFAVDSLDTEIVIDDFDSIIKTPILPDRRADLNIDDEINNVLIENTEKFNELFTQNLL